MRSFWRAPELEVTSWIFLRVLGLVALVAFVSLAVQVDGLIGARGILPAQELLARGRLLAQAHGWAGVITKVPSLLWLVPVAWTDRAIFGLHVAGAGAALSLCVGVAPRASLAVIWASYLSVVSVGSVFLHYQWDALLIEAVFTALFVAPAGIFPGRKRAPLRLGVWLLRLLLFKVLFLSGAAKLASGDPAWRNLEALSFHFLTQPLPSVLAPWMHGLPAWVLRGATFAILMVELLAPAAALSGTWFGGFRSLRLLSFWAIVVMQALIAISGDHGFFGLLVVTLALMALDDDFWRAAGRYRPDRMLRRVPPQVTSSAEGEAPATPSLGPRRLAMRAGVAAVALGVVLLDVMQAFAVLSPTLLTYRGFVLLDGLAPFHTVNRYASFPVMTKQRYEIELEASEDGATFRPYGFWYKPGRLSRPPSRAGLHMPRLDWQLWFAALNGDCRRAPWWESLARRMFEASPPVLELFEHDPNHGRKPQFLRAILYDYRFANSSAAGTPTPGFSHEEVGTWWARRPVAVFCPTMSLSGSELLFVDEN